MSCNNNEFQLLAEQQGEGNRAVGREGGREGMRTARMTEVQRTAKGERCEDGS